MILRTVAQFILATEKVRLKFYFVHSPMQQRNDITWRGKCFLGLWRPQWDAKFLPHSSRCAFTLWI